MEIRPEEFSPPQYPPLQPGTVGPCPVAPDALQGIVRQQTNPSRWEGANWPAFVTALRAKNIDIHEEKHTRGSFSTDGEVPYYAVCNIGRNQVFGKNSNGYMSAPYLRIHIYLGFEAT